MSGAFRDDLEAARSRADALHEENEALREELARIRRADAKVREEKPLLPDRGPGFDLARLAESTLEKLDHLNEEADASLPAVEEAPPLSPPKRVIVPAKIEVKPVPAPEAPSREREALVAAEERIQGLRRRAWGWGLRAFVAGILVGMLIDRLRR